MDKNLRAIIRFCKQHDGELVLETTGHELYRLIGFMSDDEDYYWNLREFGRRCKEHYDSCVGGLIPIKDYLPEEIYDNLERVWFINTEIYFKHLHLQYDKWQETNLGKRMAGISVDIENGAE